MTRALRQAFFWLHLSAGLGAGAVILNSAVTGVIMVYEPQLVAWAERHVRFVEPPAGAVRLEAEVLAAKAQEIFPRGRLNNMVFRPEPSSTVAVNMGRGEGTHYLNAYTGELVGPESKMHKWLHGVEDWHRWLWSQEKARRITGASNLIFFFMILSGLYLWWPRTWTATTFRMVSRFNGRLSGRARDWNWHNVIGFWCAPLLLLTTLTGAVVSYPWATDLLYRATGNEPPPRAAAARPAAAPVGLPPVQTAGLNRLYKAAESKRSAWAAISLRPPARPGDPATATIQGPGRYGVGNRHRSTLSWDLAAGAETKWEPYESLNSGRRARNWAVPLHTGRAAGWMGQTLMGFGALGAAFLVWTGFALSYRRFFSARLRRRSLAPKTPSPA